MVRTPLCGVALSFVLAATGAAAQSTPALPAMPPPPSFGDAAPAKAGTSVRKARKAKGAANARAASPTSDPMAFERPNKFVPAEFDGPRSGSARGGVSPMMSGSGRPGMGMKF
ncbi:hypothetical protein [Enterovirga sp.]|uniref:hypothetical protein n=1 Tax=Enterovirga sp. TaxID=2026350 RepID=UPI002C5F488F|nr:hypothetical protein [Enterovirga sp.]HMO28220.1 hypothetical protein [Enterovirga sp.]